MYDVKVYSRLDNKLAVKKAEYATISVTLKNLFNLCPVKESDLLDAIRQIERHVDYVELAAIDYDGFMYISKADENSVYETRAEMILGEARREAGEPQEELDLEPRYRVRYKRTATESSYSSARVTFSALVEYHFDNDVVEIWPEDFSIEQLRALKQVRELRAKLSASDD